MVSSTSWENSVSTLSIGATALFEETGSSRKTGMAGVDFDMFSTRVSFNAFVVTEDLEMRLAG